MEFLKKIGGYVAGFVIAYVAINLVTGGGKLKDFETFESADGGFSVSMPGKPEKTTQSIETPVGAIDLIFFSAGNKKSGFNIGYCDYPEKVIEGSDPQEMLDGARDGAINNVNGELLDETKFEFKGYPAREIKIDVPGKKITVRAQIILVKQRLYQLMVISKDDKILHDKGTKFFDSFETNKPFLCEKTEK